MRFILLLVFLALFSTLVRCEEEHPTNSSGETNKKIEVDTFDDSNNDKSEVDGGWTSEQITKDNLDIAFENKTDKSPSTSDKINEDIADIPIDGRTDEPGAWKYARKHYTKKNTKYNVEDEIYAMNTLLEETMDEFVEELKFELRRIRQETKGELRNELLEDLKNLKKELQTEFMGELENKVGKEKAKFQDQNELLRQIKNEAGGYSSRNREFQKEVKTLEDFLEVCKDLKGIFRRFTETSATLIKDENHLGFAIPSYLYLDSDYMTTLARIMKEIDTVSEMGDTLLRHKEELRDLSFRERGKYFTNLKKNL